MTFTVSAENEIGKKTSIQVSSNTDSRPMLSSTNAKESLSDVHSKNLSLKEQRQVLIDYTKQLRAKYNKLQDDCLSNKAVEKGDKECPSVASSHGIEDLVPKSEFELLNEGFIKVSSENKALREESQKNKSSLKSQSIEIESLKDELSILKDQLASLERTQEEYHNTNFSEKELLQTTLQKKTEEANECSLQLGQSQQIASKIPELERKLHSLKNQLLLRKSAEELLQPQVVAAPVSSNTKEKKSHTVDTRKKTNVETVEEMYADVTIIEISGSKVSLRAGPGVTHSSIMDVQKGTRLIVEAKESDWYRVSSPTGGRAYVHSDYIKVISAPRSFGKGVVSSSSMEVEPVKPPLPAKPIRKIGSQNSSRDPISSAVGIPVGGNTSEELAIEKLMKAMNEKFSQGEGQ
jgi:hypothetical protein